MRELFTRRNEFAGRSALILGSGPSLLGFDNAMRRHVIFAINASILDVPHPDFWCTGDPGMTRMEFWSDMQRDGCELIIPKQLLGPSRLDAVPENRIDPNRITFWLRRRKKCEYDMSVDDGKMLLGVCSPHVILHAAVVLGCSPIYLLGCDLQYRDGLRFAWEFDPKKRGFHRNDGKSRTHHICGQRAQGKIVGDHEYGPYADGKTDRHLEWFKAVWKDIIDANPQLDIRDASGGGLDGIIPQVTLDELKGI